MGTGGSVTGRGDLHPSAHAMAPTIPVKRRHVRWRAHCEAITRSPCAVSYPVPNLAQRLTDAGAQGLDHGVHPLLAVLG